MNTPTTTPLRVMIADDHRLFREGLRALISIMENVEIVAEVADGKAAVAQALATEPDVIIMDIQMPEMSGLEATRRILAASPRTGILIVSMFDDNENVFAAMQAGARGYLLKGSSPEELLRGISAVSQGEALFAPSIAQRLIRFFARPSQLPEHLFPQLTGREREILARLAQGETNTQIAHGLELSEKTVRNHISNVFAKLQVGSRAEAVLRAKEAGLGE